MRHRVRSSLLSSPFATAFAVPCNSSPRYNPHSCGAAVPGGLVQHVFSPPARVARLRSTAPPWPRRRAKNALHYVVHHIKRILVQPGRRPPARRSANISPSSWTIRVSPRRSTPAWSRPRTARATTSSGLAATAIEAGPTKEPRSRAGLRHVHGCAADQEYGDQDGRMSGFAACTS